MQTRQWTSTFTKSHWITVALTTATNLCIASLEYFITIITHRHPFYIFDHKECMFVYTEIYNGYKSDSMTYISVVKCDFLFLLINYYYCPSGMQVQHLLDAASVPLPTPSLLLCVMS